MSTEQRASVEVYSYAYFGDGTNIGVDVYVAADAHKPITMSFSLTELLEQTLDDASFSGRIHVEDKEYMLGLVDRLEGELAAFSKRLGSV